MYSILAAVLFGTVLTAENSERRLQWSDDCVFELKPDGSKTVVNGTCNHDIEEELAKASPPEVHVFSKAAKAPGNVHLICLATGFHPKEIELEIRRNKKTLVESDGIQTSGVRPNGNETFEIRTSVEIREDDAGDFACYVKHSILPLAIVMEWKEGDKCGASKSTIIAASATAIVTVIITIGLVAVVAFVLKKKGIIRTAKIPNGSTDSGKGSNSSLQKASGDGVEVATMLIASKGKGSNSSLETASGYSVDVKLMDDEGKGSNSSLQTASGDSGMVLMFS